VLDRRITDARARTGALRGRHGAVDVQGEKDQITHEGNEWESKRGGNQWE
jgi:hypothetical protein